ncbi:MAG TPA: hypothetical protein ENJ18_05635 [Nannocystis exedens]|nr:hypothetical protein [Nannocystis exedens]
MTTSTMVLATGPQAEIGFVLALALACALAALIILIACHLETLRRVLLRAIDPRPLAIFRVLFGLTLVLYALEIAPLTVYLFSDEGLLPSAAVPQVMGGRASGILGEGIRDLRSFFQYLASGRWSLLHFWDSPFAAQLHVAAFALSSFALMIGWRTRVVGVIAWLLLAGLLRRGDLHWGGEQVLLSLLFPLILSRCGAALSVDNWRRCRRLRRCGRLDEGTGIGQATSVDHAQGLAAIYRRIPAWPQVLIVCQLGLLYFVNGWVKSGSTWISGDTLWLALHLDHYARIDWHPLVVALGPWPFRLATWAVLWWERLFPLLWVGLWFRAVARVGAPALCRRRRAISRAAWLTIAVMLGVWAHFGVLAGAPGHVSDVRSGALALLAVLIAACVISGEGGLLTRTLRRGVCKLTPLPWLLFGVAFHGISLIFFEIGIFASATVSAYVLCGVDASLISLLQRTGRTLGRLGLPMPQHLLIATPVAAEDPCLPHLHRDGIALPPMAVLCAGAMILAGVVFAIAPPRPATERWHITWLVVGAGLIVIGWRRSRRPSAAISVRLTVPWAYGPAGRLLAGGVFAYHLVSLVLWQSPSWQSTPWRQATRWIVDPWMELSFTRQGWRMFAPNGPTRNQTLRTIITDQSGQVHDLHTELELPENLHRPYFFHDRSRKIDEGLSGYRPALILWHARYLCRRWALEHAQEVPARVELLRLAAPFPPMTKLDADAYFWAHAEETSLVQIRCADEPFAQIQPELRRRYGLPEARPGELKVAWPKKRNAESRAPLWFLFGLALVGTGLAWNARESRRGTQQREEPVEPKT